jgi:hypothetical protein
MNLWDLIPPQIKLVGGIVGLLAILAGAAYVHHRIDQGGYDRCVTEQKSAVADAKDKARENVVNVEKNYAPKLKELREAPDDNGGVVGPLVTRAIDGL